MDEVDVSAEDTGVIDTEGLISEPILELLEELLLELIGGAGRIIGLDFNALISTSLNFVFLLVELPSVFGGLRLL